MRIPEFIEIEGLNVDIAGTINGSAEVSSKLVDGGREYTIGFGDLLLGPEDFYSVLHATAPKPEEDYPDGVIDDWFEPDRNTQEARDRVKRHEELLGQDWYDFMVSRPTYLDIFRDIPRLRTNENEIRKLSDIEEITEFASTYLISGRNRRTIAIMLENTGLDQQTISGISAAIETFFADSYPATSNNFPLIPFNAVGLAEQVLKQNLLSLPGSTTNRIIQSILPLELEAFGYAGLQNAQTGSGGYAGSKIVPGNSFINRFCVQAIREPNGDLTAVPYAYSHPPYRRHSWYIPSWSSFNTIERDNATCLAAVALDPAEMITYNSIAAPVYAVEAGSIKSTASALRVQPQIRWQTSHCGERQFDISIGTFQTESGRIVRSGIFGIILAAAMQPELRAKWPKTIRDPSLDREQDMGVAQLPVLALKMRRQLSGGLLLSAAEAKIN